MKTNEDRITEFNIIHNFKYDYSLMDYKHSKEKIIILCPIHGPFEQLPYSHLMGKGCPNCVGRNRSHEEFIKLSNIVHGQYTYPEKYINSITKIKIHCKKDTHGDFLQTPHSHLNGRGCPKCQGVGKTHHDFVYQANK